MGLLYVFPVSTEEADFVIKQDDGLILKSYGLPYIFWFYALCCVTVVFFMFLAIKGPALKLMELGDETDVTLGYALLSFIGLIPVAIFAFFFYEKRIIRQPLKISLEHRVFGIRVFRETFQLESSDHLTVEPYLTSPNVARMKGGAETAGFQNKGYFVLNLKDQQGRTIQLDRHSRKADLEKLKALLLSSGN
jgi:hypothetical protein